MGGSFFQCMAGSGSLTRSAINQQSGAVTQWSGVFSAAAVAATVLLFADLARYIPRATLAGILMVSAWRLVDRAQLLFHLRATRFDAGIVLATALAVYVTSARLDPTLVAAQYGFTVQGDGVGTATVNVGSNGDAFGVANSSVLTVLDLLRATDAQAMSGVLYNGNIAKRNEANNVYSVLNQAGEIG